MKPTRSPYDFRFKSYGSNWGFHDFETLILTFDLCVTFWGYHTLLALKAYHTLLAVRAYSRLDGSVGMFIDLTSDDSHPGAVLTGCHSGSLSDHENVRLDEVSAPRVRSVLSQSLEGKDVLQISEI